MRDLLIITPTRQRPGNARRLADAVQQTATAQTDLVFTVDDDDRSYDDGIAGAQIVRGPRRSCIEWTNIIAAQRGSQYLALASLGDDHVPVTRGWDRLLLSAIGDMSGTGIAYGDDTLQHENLPTAPVISSDIVAALEWMMYPRMIHYYCDDIWKDIAGQAGCLTYLPNVVVQHFHHSFGTAPRDQVYNDAEPAMGPDAATYRQYVAAADGLAADVAKIRKLTGGWR